MALVHYLFLSVNSKFIWTMLNRIELYWAGLSSNEIQMNNKSPKTIDGNCSKYRIIVFLFSEPTTQTIIWTWLICIEQRWARLRLRPTSQKYCRWCRCFNNQMSLLFQLPSIIYLNKIDLKWDSDIRIHYIVMGRHGSASNRSGWRKWT